jgi:hypothetical protein
VPIYREALTSEQEEALLQIRAVFLSVMVLIVAPRSLNIDRYRRILCPDYVELQEDYFFYSQKTYNRLVMSPQLYAGIIRRHEWHLIYQDDAFVFNDQTDYFSSLEYHYFGAPWPRGNHVMPLLRNGQLSKTFGNTIFVGNGGLSLRNTEAVLAAISDHRLICSTWRRNEDEFFSYIFTIDDRFKMPPLELAAKFSWETSIATCRIMTNEQLPMGIHGIIRRDPNLYSLLLQRYKNEKSDKC